MLRVALIPFLCLCLPWSAMAAALPALVDDAEFAAKYAEIRANPPQPGQVGDLIQWHLALATAAGASRAHLLGERALRAALLIAPAHPQLHANLSVYLGKQGRYQEALDEAELAILLDPIDTTHAEAVACSWMAKLGRAAEAKARFAAIAKPEELDRLSLYWGCAACFHADLGEVAAAQAAIAEMLTTASSDERKQHSMQFLRRDPAFDRYRGEAWFIAIAGKTLAK